LIAFTLLTGARDGALASFKIKHIDVSNRRVLQDAREVNTKFSKSFPTFFFPIDPMLDMIVASWVAELSEQLLYGPDDPLFPSTKVELNGSGQFASDGLSREHWSTASPIRVIFRKAFTSAGLPYFNPHAFRNTLVEVGQTRCRTPEQFKAWSQNLGHEGVLTTFVSYGAVSSQRQSELIAGLSSDPSKDGRDSLNEVIVKLTRIRDGE
jgi:integrase